MSNKQVVSLANLPACAGGGNAYVSRRNFCAAAGAGLIAIGLPGCGNPGIDRIGVGTVPSDTSGAGDIAGVADASNNGGSTADLANPSGQTGSPADLAGQTTTPPVDMAQPAEATCATTGVNAGAASAIVAGTALHISQSGANLFVCRDASGLYAMSAVCTHQGATLEQDGSDFYCSRHGATFDLNGQNPTSPAHTALKHYALCVDASGNVYVDTSTTVAATTRT